MKEPFAPPITRVHDLLRIRTVVNAVSDLNDKKRFPHDTQITEVLATTGLSKYRKDVPSKIKDRIMRRSRDHLLTASYIGMLTRQGRPLLYRSTTAGRYLQAYKWGEEFPRDEVEESVFIDRLMRMKLTNVYDLQERGQYSRLRSRPVLFVLYVLTEIKWVHEHQMAVTSGGSRCDPLLLDKSTGALIKRLAQSGEPSPKVIRAFYKEYGVRNSDMKNMTRNIRPLLDWCESLGLVESKEVDGTPGRWWSLTDRGNPILGMYREKLPLWYADLGRTPAMKAAVVLLLQFAKDKGVTFDRDFLRTELQTGLFTTTVGDLVDQLRKLGIKYDGSRLETDIDFTFDYDVPPEEKDQVVSALQQLAKAMHLKWEAILADLEKPSITKVKSLLESMREGIVKQQRTEFAKRAELKETDPVMEEVGKLIPTVGVLNSYKSPFEREVMILLKLMKLNAMKYQGQFADRCTKLNVMRFFENNPDILVLNGIEVLVECKSIGEWVPPLAGVKTVPKELFIYQQYMPEVKPDSTTLVYEGPVKGESRTILVGILRDTQDVVFVNKNYILDCINTPPKREHLVEVVTAPRKFSADQRLLVA